MGGDLGFEFVGAEGSQHMADQGSGTAMNQLPLFSFSIGNCSQRGLDCRWKTRCLKECALESGRGNSQRHDGSQRSQQSCLEGWHQWAAGNQPGAPASPFGSAPSLAPAGAKDSAPPKGLAGRVGEPV